MLLLQSLTTAFIVADFNALQAAGRKLNSPGTSREIAFLVVTVAAVAAFWIGLYVWDRLKQPATAPTEGAGLFGELCRVHHLSKSERDLLLKIGHDLNNPALAFIDIKAIEYYESVNTDDAEACRRLRDKLFSLS